MSDEYGISNPLRGVSSPSADELVSLRHRVGLSQAAISDLIGVDRHTWSRYERGARAMSVSAWAVLLLVLGEHPRLRIVVRDG